MINELTKSYMDIDEFRLLIVNAKGDSISQYPRDPEGRGYRLLNEHVDALIRLPRWSEVTHG